MNLFLQTASVPTMQRAIATGASAQFPAQLVRARDGLDFVANDPVTQLSSN